jgi:hypothetical protein
MIHTKIYKKIYVTLSHMIQRIERMTRFLDSHKIGSFTEEQLMELQNLPLDEFGVKHLNILYNHEANIVCIII